MDSLAGLKVDDLTRASRIADLGAGAGFPGLVLAAALPSTQVDLVEASSRKCEVAARLARGAGIANVVAVAERAEDWARSDGAEAYGAVVVRAVASLAVLVEYAAPLLAPSGLVVAWKGARDPEEERAGEVAAAGVGLRHRERVAVVPFPGSRERSLHVFVKERPTPDHFPRRPGMAKKRPLA